MTSRRAAEPTIQPAATRSHAHLPAAADSALSAAPQAMSISTILTGQPREHGAIGTLGVRTIVEQRGDDPRLRLVGGDVAGRGDGGAITVELGIHALLLMGAPARLQGRQALAWTAVSPREVRAPVRCATPGLDRGWRGAVCRGVIAERAKARVTAVRCAYRSRRVAAPRSHPAPPRSGRPTIDCRQACGRLHGFPGLGAAGPAPSSFPAAWSTQHRISTSSGCCSMR